MSALTEEERKFVEGARAKAGQAIAECERYDIARTAQELVIARLLTLIDRLSSLAPQATDSFPHIQDAHANCPHCGQHVHFSFSSSGHHGVDDAPQATAAVEGEVTTVPDGASIEARLGWLHHRVKHRVDAILERDGSEEAATTGRGVGISYGLANDIARTVHDAEAFIRSRQGVVDREALAKWFAEGFMAPLYETHFRMADALIASGIVEVKPGREAIARALYEKTGWVVKLENACWDTRLQHENLADAVLALFNTDIKTLGE